jgi:hypothetical protein
MDDTRRAADCPRCGRPLDPDAPEGLCPVCVLTAAAEPEAAGASAPDDETALATADAAGAVTPPAAAGGDRPRLEAGQPFGSYRIVRPLGRGGMGEVYEAEHVESGRRLALKVLRSRLGGAADRARFLREGQLAASVSHPHTVYIFGSEEIAGMPVITMELLPGGTLKDRVAQAGPLPWPEAVSAVLDLVGGLDAAQAAGILHRDIKPSNCFTDADGAVKVGDFGLSISTLARDVQAPAGPRGFEGTPQFAPPEQLRGEPLDVRADIYAVGATLYYLLTGTPPFDADDLGQLFRRVTEDPPPSPRLRRPGLPAGLAAVVLRCLAKDPGARPASYAALAEALRPYSFADRVPARLGLRTVAGLIDAVLVAAPANLMQAWTTTAAAGVQTSARVDATTAVIGILYYLALEGATGASLGKRLFGLRVAGAGGAASFGAIAVRTAVFSTSQLVLLLLLAVVGRERLTAWFAESAALGAAAALAGIGVTAALFLTARRANGYAAVHDLVSGTRVIARASGLARRRAPAPRAEPLWAPAPADAPPRCGPFDVLGEAGERDDGRRLLLGFDPALRRRVWIRTVAPGTPPVAEARRDVGRTGRLRWLAGRRSPGENWDAYEAPDGALFQDRTPAAGGWPVVKGWLLDLANELAASEREDGMPRLALDRVWIRADGRAVLLDFPAPRDGTPRLGGASPPAGGLTPVALLDAMARAALAASSRPSGFAPGAIPLAASTLLDRWAVDGAGSRLAIDQAARDLAAVVESPDHVLRWRRAVPIAAAAAPTIMLLLGALMVIPMFRSAVTPRMFEVYGLLAALNAATGTTAGPMDVADRQAIEVYLAGRHGEVLANAGFWSSAVARSDLSRLRATAEALAASRPSVEPAELARAEAAVAPRIAMMRREYDATIAPQLARATAFIAVALVGIGLGTALVAAVISALAVPGGILLRLLGFAVVTRDGVEIGRARSLARGLVAWAPVLVWLAWLGPSPVDRALTMSVSPALVAGIVLAVMGAGAAWTIARPERGPVGLVTRTTVVTR